jgi:predicted MPP superfamily phosphohydrolase
VNRLRGRRRRYFTLLVTIALGIQIPALLTVGKLSGRYGLATAGCVALSLPILLATRQRPGHWFQTRRQLLGVWPFFIWWAICLTYLMLVPVGLLVAAVSPVTLDQALLGTGIAALIGGLRALRRRPVIRRREVAVVDLPAALDGYRVAQISDLHCGPFISKQQVSRWVAAVNALDPDLIAVTGDLIASGDRYVEAVADALGGLDARDGTFACMGNHDYFGDGEALAARLERNGITVLRNRGVVVGRGGGRFFLAGVDDTWSARHDLRRALAERPPGMSAVLLAHDPDLFPGAAAAGVDLTLSGHTHGGQLAFPLAPRRWNMAKMITPFTSDLYKLGESSLYVNRGLGFTGPPIRIGAAPEIAVLTLRRARPASSLAA